MMAINREFSSYNSLHLLCFNSTFFHFPHYCSLIAIVLFSILVWRLTLQQVLLKFFSVFHAASVIIAKYPCDTDVHKIATTSNKYIPIIY